MRKKAGLILIALGTVLFLLALSLFLYNRWEANRAGDAAEEATRSLIRIIQAGTEEAALLTTEAAEEAAETAEDDDTDPVTSVTVDGYAYIGVLTIPALDLELPVMADWSYAGLKVAPCRYSGSAEGGNLVICAHNYERHFGKLKYLSLGAAVTFTAVDGTVYSYQVTELMTLQPTAIDELMEGDWDLALYTCTIGGKTRVVVRCRLVDQ